jgi:hypothetical protein
MVMRISRYSAVKSGEMDTGSFYRWRSRLCSSEFADMTDV